MFICRVSPLQTRHFCFGKSAQNHFCLFAALLGPSTSVPNMMARELALLKQPSPKCRFGTPAPPRPTQEEEKTFKLSQVQMIKTFVRKAAGTLARAAYALVREHDKGPRTPMTDVLIIPFRVPPPLTRIKMARNSLRSNSLAKEADSGQRLRRTQRRKPTDTSQPWPVALSSALSHANRRE